MKAGLAKRKRKMLDSLNTERNEGSNVEQRLLLCVFISKSKS